MNADGGELALEEIRRAAVQDPRADDNRAQSEQHRDTARSEQRAGRASASYWFAVWLAAPGVFTLLAIGIVFGYRRVLKDSLLWDFAGPLAYGVILLWVWTGPLFLLCSLFAVLSATRAGNSESRVVQAWVVTGLSLACWLFAVTYLVPRS